MTTTAPPRPRLARALAVGLAAATTLAAASITSAYAAPPVAVSATAPDLGPNVTVFDPSMPVATIQAKADAVYAQQVNAEMGTGRFALLFKPGTYGTAGTPLQIKVGYDSEVSGLGSSPLRRDDQRQGRGLQPLPRTVNLGAGSIDHVVDGIGAAADTTRTGTPVYVVDYPTP